MIKQVEENTITYRHCKGWSNGKLSSRPFKHRVYFPFFDRHVDTRNENFISSETSCKIFKLQQMLEYM